MTTNDYLQMGLYLAVLVFPLALCLVPALYVVCLGPVVVRILRTIL